MMSEVDEQYITYEEFLSKSHLGYYDMIYLLRAGWIQDTFHRGHRYILIDEVAQDYIDGRRKIFASLF